MLDIQILSLFPSFFESPLQIGVLGRAIRSGRLQVHFINPRDFTQDVHQSVDHPPFGGGDGMVMMYAPIQKALKSLASTGLIYSLSPQGKRWNYAMARKWATQESQKRTFICGRYSGIDQRIINEFVHEEISIGDYILTGGEAALLVILDSMCRFMENVLGNPSSANNESFEHHQLLECPQWTKPRDIPGHQIPSVMLSGHHQKIQQFRYEISLLLTAVKRPDLLISNPAAQDLPQALSMASNLPAEELQACGLCPEDLKSLLKNH